MKWLILIIIVLLIFRSPAVGFWGVILFFLYVFAKKLSRQTGRDDDFDRSSTYAGESMRSPQLGLSFGQLADLLVLRRELERLRDSGKIGRKTFRQLSREVDQLEQRFFTDHGVCPGNEVWNERLDSAWDILNFYADSPLGPAPWKEMPAEPVITLEASQHDVIEPAAELSDLPDEVAVEPPIRQSDPLPVQEEKPEVPPASWAENPVSAAAMLGPAELKIELTQAAAAAELNTSRTTDKISPDIENYAWQRHEPGPLENALKKLSGWHALAAPFLVQNIGWFIGVFLFIAGSIFLVSYSTGYLKSLIVFLTFFLFTLFLLWGGYQIRRKRPDLSVSSDVVLILSLLLVPLTTATVTRLLISSETLFLKIVSGMLAAVELGAFHFTATLVSALMDRSLQGRLPKLFLALTFAQLLLAILQAFPFWPLLAISHGILLALLGIGIYRFVHDWLHSIFIDRRKIAYFAAGMLVYAAVVSFVHLTYGAPSAIGLPAGYYGPFLMLLCGLLFYVDAEFKQWTQSNPSLSRFSFFVYGVSVLSLIWVAGYTVAIQITLVLAIALYALVIRRYLTLTPLYLFLGCCFWLYQLTVLRHFPASAHFLAALPGLAGLYWLAGWSTRQRRSAYLALIVFRVLYALAVLLTLWSLLRSDPGMPAMATAMAAGVLFYYALKLAPEHLFTVRERMPETLYPSRYRSLLDSSWFYLLPMLAAATAYYAPPLTGLTSGQQFAFAVLAVAVFLSVRGVFLYAHWLAAERVDTLERHFNTALLTLLVAALPVVSMSRPLQALWLMLAGLILLGLSLKLELRGLFYLMLGCWGGAAGIFKLTYFPWPTVGLMPMLSASAVWLFLKYLHYLDRLPVTVLLREQAELRARLRPAFVLLWRFPVNART
ncbi:MAG: hypothetical protein ACU83P_11270 [Gammaproteobacteria bacterium]